MYSIEELKELINAIDNSSLTEIKVKSADGELSLKKQMTVSGTAQPILSVPVEAALAAKEEDAEDAFDVIESPMVGVFYAAPSPDSRPFVTVGQTVAKGETVCIVEAMKLMNEITAEKSGVIAEVCVNNGDIVEFGQPLFKIK